eukprot:3071436-Rhodomonas_salina.1
MQKPEPEVRRRGGRRWEWRALRLSCCEGAEFNVLLCTALRYKAPSTNHVPAIPPTCMMGTQPLLFLAFVALVPCSVDAFLAAAPGMLKVGRATTRFTAQPFAAAAQARRANSLASLRSTRASPLVMALSAGDRVGPFLSRIACGGELVFLARERDVSLTHYPSLLLPSSLPTSLTAAAPTPHPPTPFPPVLASSPRQVAVIGGFERMGVCTLQGLVQSSYKAVMQVISSPSPPPPP